MISLSEHLNSRQLTLNEISRRTKLPVDRVSLIVEGAEASLSEMRKISRALRVPLSALLGDRETEEGERVNVLLRQTIGQRGNGLDSSMLVISEQIRDVIEISAALPRQILWLNLFRGLNASVENAENFASIFRKAFGSLDDLDPFTFLAQTLEELGVFVLFGRDHSVEGVSAVVDGRAVILLAPRSFRPRILFTLAHEVGHLVARHDRREQNFALMDSEVGSGHGQDEGKDDERFADAFASSLLLPRQGVVKVLKAAREHFKVKGPLGDIEISLLARFFSVSFEVAARRCEQLELLPDRGARALYQRISDDFGNPERRAEELGLPDREEIAIQTSPALIGEASRLVREGLFSAGRAAELLNVPVSMLFVANAG